MSLFTFSKPTEKAIRVDASGSIVIRSKEHGTVFHKAQELDIIYVKDPVFLGTGIVYLSFDGKLVPKPESKAAGFSYTQLEKKRVNELIESLRSLNGEIRVQPFMNAPSASTQTAPAKPEPTVIRCPQCDSTNTEYAGNQRKSFSVGKAVGGALLTGGYGALAGFAGKKGRDRWHCKECGNLFET